MINDWTLTIKHIIEYPLESLMIEWIYRFDSQRNLLLLSSVIDGNACSIKISSISMLGNLWKSTLTIQLLTGSLNEKNNVINIILSIE